MRNSRPRHARHRHDARHQHRREIHNVTIYEHDRVSADRDGASPQTHALVDRLNAGEPYAVAFGGQGSAWLETLEELVRSEERRVGREWREVEGAHGQEEIA